MYEVSFGYPKNLIQKSYIWASFLISRKRFCKLQEAIWLTVVNKKFDLFCQVNCMYNFSSSYQKDPTKKWYIWTSFQTFRKKFDKLQETIWSTVINKICKSPSRLGPFYQINWKAPNAAPEKAPKLGKLPIKKILDTVVIY